MSDHACRTDRSSGAWKEELRTDVKSTEAFSMTAMPKLVVNSWRSCDAMYATLPSRKASSPMRADREWISLTGTWDGEDTTAPESAVRACCATAHSARLNFSDASLSSVSASSTRRWFC